MKREIGLMPRVAVAMALGILLDMVAPAAVVRAVNTFAALFDQFIKFLVPLIIVGLVTPAIAETGRGAGKMLLLTVALAYVSTFCAGLLGYFVSAWLFPLLVSSGTWQSLSTYPTFEPYVNISIPPMIDVMSALVFSFVAGLGMVFTEANALKRAFCELRAVVTNAITRALLPLLPVYIFGLFLNMTAEGRIWKMLSQFAVVIAVFSALTVVVVVVQFCVAGLVTRKNPLKAMWTMMPAYMTALGTSSSAAAIPVTHGQSIANGVSRQVADFTVPLCATVHLAGSTVKIVSCAVALMLINGRAADVNISTFSGFIAMVGIMMVAAPGVPGGAVMAALGVLESVLGFGQEMLALMIALYVSTDSIGTACNVAGDGAIAMIVDKMSR